MAQQTINIGTSANKGDGDPLRTAFDKINDNFDELYNNVSTLQSGGSTSINSGSTLVVNAVQGSVIGDDSSVILDATTSTVDASKLTGPLPAIDGSALTNLTIPAQTFTSLTGKPTTIAGYGITDAYTKTEVDNAITSSVLPAGSTQSIDIVAADSTVLVDSVNGTLNATTLTGALPAIDGSALTGVTAIATSLDGDVTGSVFADDSTLLVDGVNGKIVGDIQNNLIETNNITALPGDTDLYIQGGIDSGTPGNPARVNIGTTNTSTIILGASDSLIYVNGNDDSVIMGGTGIFGTITGDLTGSVFGDDSTLLVDGVGGTIAGPISSINWMAASDSYLTISNGGSTQPGPIQIVASANLNLSSGNNNDINITPHGSGRVKVSDGAFGIVEAANFIGHADETMYLSSKTTGSESTHIALNSTSGVATTMYGAVDFVSGGSVDFTGSTVTGLNVTGDITGDITGSIFADDSTLLVDGVNGTINSSALTKPIDLDDAEEVRFGTDNDMRILHSGTSALIQNTTGTLVIAGPIVRIQDAGTSQSAFTASNGIATLYHLNSTKLETTTDGVAVTGRITGLTDPTDAQDAATKAYVDANSGGSGGGAAFTNIGIGADDSTIRSIGEGESFLILGGTGITTASDAEGNITITASGGSGLQSRSSVTGTTSSLADAAEADLDITGFKSYALLTITTDRAARVRLYVSDATRTADASRAEGVDPTSDAGLIAEVITTGADTVIISPGAYGFNLESSPTTTIPCRVTNKSGGTSTVQVDLNILQLEA